MEEDFLGKITFSRVPMPEYLGLTLFDLNQGQSIFFPVSMM